MNKIDDEEVEEELPCQISPVFTKDGEISTAEFDFTFLGEMFVGYLSVWNLVGWVI